MSQLKKGAVLSYVNIFLTNTVGLILTPFIIRSFGNSEYGLYALIGSFVVYLTLMDLGLNNTIVRFVSKYRAEKDVEGEQRFLGTTMLIYFAISIALVIIGFFLYVNLEVIFGKSLNPSQIGDAKIMFLVLVFNIAITLPGGTFLAICTAYGEFVFPKVLMIIKYILRSLAVYIILTLGGKSISLVLIDTVFSVLVILTTFYYCVSKLKVKFNFHGSNKKMIKQIFSYSVWIFILVIIMSFEWNAGQLILGINTNTEVVAVFAVGLMLGGYFGAFAGVINTLLLPKAATMVAGFNTPKELTTTMIMVGRANMFISLLILSGFFVLGKEFIQLWLGGSYMESWNIALIIMCATLIPLSQSFGNSILEIKNKVKYRAIGMLISMVLAVIVAYILSKEYGLYGVLLPIAVGFFINAIISNVLFVKVFDFQIVSFYKETFLIQIIFAVLLIVFSVLIKNNLVIDSWLSFLIAGSIYTALYVTLYVFLVFTKEEKNLIIKRIRY
jgi:O-antigen/teichoic acid export membrane protein